MESNIRACQSGSSDQSSILSPPASRSHDELIAWSTALSRPSFRLMREARPVAPTTQRAEAVFSSPSSVKVTVWSTSPGEVHVLDAGAVPEIHALRAAAVGELVLEPPSVDLEALSLCAREPGGPHSTRRVTSRLSPAVKKPQGGLVDVLGIEMVVQVEHVGEVVGAQLERGLTDLERCQRRRALPLLEQEHRRLRTGALDPP